MRASPLLPPLHALRAFEAVARHAGVSRASRELLITQSAVSQHVRKLEQDLGATLFVRHGRGMTLTEAGQRYYETVSRAFALIAEGTAALACRRVVRVSVLPSFAAHWLGPRLAGFRAAYPDIEVELDPTLAAADFAGDGVDLAVRYGDGRWPGVEASLLMTERLTPVLGPEAGPIETLPLLMTKKAFDWKVWAEAERFDLSARRQVQLTDYNVVLQAALRGEGLALGRLSLVDPLIAKGQLVAPFATVVRSPKAAYWLLRPEARAPAGPARIFAEWISDEARRET
ncbi:LysR substrate-binding domain-containing protein [Caulobacter sp. FWC2]|uniref:LysR substrate-binding domain-containing protein n=1 Tax=Caulobacter sp. FWC2 TaxID=69664 RepID=UPI000C14B61D|nr:LysR substrate-binding domain-containing protein [Caulobacter sp. FWC2]PIB91813.1 LysR family transcriptional regulator [Caulobacter sp. FWC2]